VPVLLVAPGKANPAGHVHMQPTSCYAGVEAGPMLGDQGITDRRSRRPRTVLVPVPEVDEAARLLHKTFVPAERTGRVTDLRPPADAA
jgi:hypothetical protein